MPVLSCSTSLRGPIPSLLAGLARRSLRVRLEAPAAPAGQVPPAAPRGQRRGPCRRRVERLRELLRCQTPQNFQLIPVPGGRGDVGRLLIPSCPPMADEEEPPAALSDNQVFALTCIYLAASLLSLLGSGSVLAVTSRQRRCCHIQLRPLFLLALADFLASAAVLSTATIQLLPAPLFIPAYAACPYGAMLLTTFYSVSFLMVVVYAYEAHRTVHGRRGWHVAALQEWVPGEHLAGVAVHPGLAGDSAHTAGAADRPRHLQHRHRTESHRALERQPLRDLQPVLLQLPAPHPPRSGCLLRVRREEGRGPGGENRLLLVPAAGAQLLHAPVPPGEAVVPEDRGSAFAGPGEGRLREQEHPQRQHRLPLLPAGFPALLGTSLPPHPHLLHQHQTCLGFCPLCCYSSDRLPPRLPAQSGLRLVEAKLPRGGSGQEVLPAAPPGPPGFL
ncbi:uncharacterized protein [Phaenicophaeus curvirostris]|uniref:uncharacterized protein isoform X2 n=1 Tax=Phaenicophaeus curvirostris TaxID=33595 RepID=UPI0037F0DE1D